MTAPARPDPVARLKAILAAEARVQREAMLLHPEAGHLPTAMARRILSLELANMRLMAELAGSRPIPRPLSFPAVGAFA